MENKKEQFFCYKCKETKQGLPKCSDAFSRNFDVCDDCYGETE